MCVSLVYVAMVVMDFRLAEYIYDNYLIEALGANEKMLHHIFKVLHQFMENTVYAFLRAIRDLIFAFLLGVIPNLPGPLRYPLDMMGLTTYMEKTVNMSMEDKKKERKEYMEYAKEIEKNRPKSPAHNGKNFDFPDASKEKEV